MIGAFLTLLIFLLGVLIWLTPLPVFYSFRYRGIAQGLLTLGLFIVLLGALYFGTLPWIDALLGIGHFLLFGIVGVLLGLEEPRLRSVTDLFLRVCMPLWVLILVLGLSFYFYHGETWIQGIEGYFQAFMLELTKATPPDMEAALQMQAFKDSVPRTAYWAVRLLPGVILNMVLFVVWLNLLVAKRVFQKVKPFEAMGSLSQWRLPFFVIWVVIGFGVLLAVNSYLLKIEGLMVLALNSFLVFSFIYFLQGLAILSFYVQRRGYSGGIRFFIYSLLAVFFNPLGIFLVIVGFFDSWFDFRKLTAKPAGS